MIRIARPLAVLLGLSVLFGVLPLPSARGAVTRDEVERAIREGVRYLKAQQRDDGSWPEVDLGHRTGCTSLATLALLTAGESPDSSQVDAALKYLRQFSPEQLRSVYAVSLQTMVFAAARPDRDQLRITGNVAWLQRAQIKRGDRVPWPGSWTYKAEKVMPGDNSNTQYALLALNAASEVGVPIDPEVWKLARGYWERAQRGDGSWAYQPDVNAPATASMSCAGISSLVISGLKRYQGQEVLNGDTIQHCGEGRINVELQRATDWLASHFFVGQNLGLGQRGKYYYLYGLERAGRLTGQRFFGKHDWYREGAEELVHDQDKLLGYWKGSGFFEDQPQISTCFALLFLAKGRSPVLINKLRHGPGGDWNLDTDDVRNLVGNVSRDWKHLLTWQVVDPAAATVEDLLQAPILYFNGHEAPEFTPEAEKSLRDYIDQGGFIMAEACCSRPEFDKGFRELVGRLFPEDADPLKPLSGDHAVWRSRHELIPEIHPLWGVEHGCRTVLIYTPEDLSCYWNQSESQPANPAVLKAIKVGQNIVDYATGREMPADKLTARSVVDLKQGIAPRGALHVAKLRHAGDWNVAPLAVPNLMSALRDTLKYDVVLQHKELFPQDQNLVNFPLIYMHGRAAVSFSPEDLERLRKHLEPGGGTLFADAACGSTAFDAAFRVLVGQILPDRRLEPIPHDDPIYKTVGYDLKDVQYSKGAGGGKNYPVLEGVKIDGHWGIIYSKYDIGCALERHQGPDCKGYSPESALRIAANIIIYATLP